ncbi:hypothetical protein AVEN_124774-1 [Araneus ventricosus]|uniref:Uncharacterized protein n=1 Tax=Araneus ventricosus TaxID=182803 RepID=A0A4Y2LPK7_ARAVE|nr:hypothetical protein AVEN_124774-1 [Araneus ventricosus]
MKTGFTVDWHEDMWNGVNRIAVPPMYLYATIVSPDPVRTLSHTTRPPTTLQIATLGRRRNRETLPSISLQKSEVSPNIGIDNTPHRLL